MKNQKKLESLKGDVFQQSFATAIYGGGSDANSSTCKPLGNGCYEPDVDTAGGGIRVTTVIAKCPK